MTCNFIFHLTLLNKLILIFIKYIILYQVKQIERNRVQADPEQNEPSSSQTCVKLGSRSFI